MTSRLRTRWWWPQCCESSQSPMLEARACDVRAIFILILYCRTQDDLAIMIEGSDGQYYLQAGAVLLAGPSLPSDFFLVDVGMQM